MTEQKLCPVCGKPMNYQANKANPKAPDWKCSDANCKYSYNKNTKQWEPSDFITGLWDKTQTPARKFETSLNQDVRNDNIKENMAIKLAVETFYHGKIDLDYIQEFAQTIYNIKLNQ